MYTLVRYSFRISRASAVVMVSTAVVLATVGVLLSFLTGQLVSAVSVPTDFLVALAGLGVAFGVAGVAPVLVRAATTATADVVRKEADLRLARTMLAPPDIAHLEDASVQDRFELARGRSDFAIRAGLVAVPGLIQSRLAVLGSAALIGWLFAWWAALILLGSAACVEWYAARLTRQEWASWQAETRGHRRADYLFELAMDTAAKELRVFDLGAWLTGNQHAGWLAAIRPVWRAGRRTALLGTAIAAINVGVSGTTIWFAVRAAAAGELPLSDVAAVVPAILLVGRAAGNGGAAHVERGRHAYRAMRELDRTVRAGSVERTGAPPRSAQALPCKAIRFEDVGFRYPGRDVDVLCGFDLEMRAGESLALVGGNGAGKSTVLKLLSGVLQPTSGRITVDGIDLRELDIESWQHRIATVVQDFVRLPLSARDNVRLGHGAPDELDTIAERAGINGVVRNLPTGWESLLDKAYDDGAELSGGEWQRFALARALYALRRGAGVLVLDEPAAALDVRAEAELVDRYLELTEGVTAIVISHRFSVVRDNARICVLEGRQIVEDGTHADLLATNGRYATMFRLQAGRYVNQSDVPDA